MPKYRLQPARVNVVTLSVISHHFASCYISFLANSFHFWHAAYFDIYIDIFVLLGRRTLPIRHFAKFSNYRIILLRFRRISGNFTIICFSRAAGWHRVSCGFLELLIIWACDYFASFVDYFILFHILETVYSASSSDYLSWARHSPPRFFGQKRRPLFRRGKRFNSQYSRHTH